MDLRKQLARVMAAGLLLGVVGSSRPVRAGERVTLSNGFEMRCDHHAQVGSHIRLYLDPGEGSYLERKPEDILAVEHVADPPNEKPASARGAQDAKLSAADLQEMLAAAGQQHNVDVDLLASVVKAESNGNARAVSHAGARGLMQLMPKTASDHGVDDRFKPDENVRGGTEYLDEMLARYHDNLTLALAAYNAGPAAVDKYHGIPPYHETRVYVARVIHEFNRRVLARRNEAVRQAHSPQSTALPVSLATSSTR